MRADLAIFASPYVLVQLLPILAVDLQGRKEALMFALSPAPSGQPIRLILGAYRIRRVTPFIHILLVIHAIVIFFELI